MTTAKRASRLVVVSNRVALPRQSAAGGLASASGAEAAGACALYWAGASSFTAFAEASPPLPLVRGGIGSEST